MNNRKQLNFSNSILSFITLLLGRTWRFSFAGHTAYSPEKRKSTIYCLWHENILAASLCFKDSHECFLASHSRDGRLISSILQSWGNTLIEGSFRRGGVSAIRESVRKLQQGYNLFTTPDGPRGPYHVVKRGIALIALLANAEVVPIQFNATLKWRLSSWDNFIIPMPFTKISVIYGTPVKAQKKNSTNEDTEIITQEIQTNLFEI